MKKVRPQKAKVELKEFPSEDSSLKKFERFFNSLRRRYRIFDDDYHRIYLTSSEAFINAMVHGNKRDPNKKVRVKFKVFKKFFTIEIQDEGEGFIPEAIPDPTIDENLLKDSGRGVFIMKAFADEVKFRKTKSGMKVIIKIKKRSGAL